MHYTKKPVTIEAVRFIGLTDFGDPQFDVTEGIPDWLMEAMSGPEHSTGSMWTAPGQAFIGEGDPPKGLFIGTMEGQHIASPGDWIIQGIKGELYPCRDDIFRATYAAAVAPEFTQVIKDGERSLLLDMRSECIQLRVALAKARDQFAFYGDEHQAKAETNYQFAALCQTAIDCRPATGSPDCPKLEELHATGQEALNAALEEADASIPSDLPAGSVARLRSAAKPFIIGEGYATIGDGDGNDGA